MIDSLKQHRNNRYYTVYVVGKVSSIGIKIKFVMTSEESLEAILNIIQEDHEAQCNTLLGLAYILALAEPKLGCVMLASYVTPLGLCFLTS